MEIILNEDVPCEFEESNDIDLETIDLDDLSINYYDGTENYADYFLKKDNNLYIHSLRGFLFCSVWSYLINLFTFSIW